MKAHLLIATGGRIAEEMIFGKDKISNGAASDIQMVTNLAKKMITEWGMSEKLGRLRYNNDSEEVFLGHSVAQSKNVSEDTAKVIDAEVKRLVEEAKTKARKIITENNLDGILFSSKPEIRYFIGFFTQFWQSPTRPWFIFIPVDKRPVAIIPSIGQRLMRDCFIEEIYTWSSPAGDYDGIQLLSEIISKRLKYKQLL